MDHDRFEVRRSLLQGGLQVIFSAVLLVLLAVNIPDVYSQYGLSSQLFTGLIFCAVIAFYLWNSIIEFRDRKPQMIIEPAGLLIPAALDQHIPWPRLWRVQHATNLMGGRIDIETDQETALHVKAGTRLLGATITRRRGMPNGFSIYTQAYDRRTPDIMSAIRRYWPPADPHDDEDDGGPL